MRRNIFIVIMMIAAACSFIACNPNPEIEVDYNKLVVNNWRLSTVNDVYIANQNMIIYNIKSDGTMTRALGVANYGWMECPNFHYTVNSHYLTLEGVDPQSNEWEIKLDISRINSKSMTFGVVSVKKNGMMQVADNNIYTFVQNEDKDYAPKLVGCWQGKETSANTTGTKIFYVRMDAAGNMTYYDYNYDTEMWNSSFTTQYFVYGEILAHNFYSNNGTAHYCWTIYVDNANKIRLKALSADASLVEYTFNRVDDIPQ